MSEYVRIKNCECRPGEPKEYCQLRDRLCKIEAVHPDTHAINKEFKKTFSDSEYSHIDELSEKFEEGLNKAKNEIMKNVLRTEVRKINKLISVDYKLISPEIESQLNFQDLLAEIEKNYAHHEEGTFVEILERASKLKPYNDIIEVKNDKLVLRHHVGVGTDSWDKGKPRQVYDTYPDVVAFGRLADIILNGTEPSKSSTRIGYQVDEKWGYEFWNEREVGDPNIKSIKFYKNDKLEIRFRKSEEAEKMRKVLKFL